MATLARMTTATEAKTNTHFRFDKDVHGKAARRAKREYRTLTDIVTAAVEAYAAGEKGVTFPLPADPDE